MFHLIYSIHYSKVRLLSKFIICYSRLEKSTGKEWDGNENPAINIIYKMPRNN